MLRLLAQREQGYDDIAALMGLSVGEVRAKVVGALAQLEAEGEPRPDVPPPFPVAGEEGAPPAKAPEKPTAAPKADAPVDPPSPEPTPEQKAAPTKPSTDGEKTAPAKAERA
jgi:pyruvate/2-oxoglutarate dehydrogenase complex dihydrolipoamide acyltransferase (E2) component